MVLKLFWPCDHIYFLHIVYTGCCLKCFSVDSNGTRLCSFDSRSIDGLERIQSRDGHSPRVVGWVLQRQIHIWTSYDFFSFLLHSSRTEQYENQRPSLPYVARTTSCSSVSWRSTGVRSTWMLPTEHMTKSVITGLLSRSRLVFFLSSCLSLILST